MKQLEQFLEWGGMKKEIAFLVISGAALLAGIFCGSSFPVDPAWEAILPWMPLTLCWSTMRSGRFPICCSFPGV